MPGTLAPATVSSHLLFLGFNHFWDLDPPCPNILKPWEISKLTSTPPTPQPTLLTTITHTTTHPPSTTHNIPHQHTIHPKSNPNHHHHNLTHQPPPHHPFLTIPQPTTTQPTLHPPHQPLPLHPTHHPIPPPHNTTHPTTSPHWRKSGALMPDISWAPPHSLPIR